MSMCDNQRPHRANQPAWRAIKQLYSEHGEVRLDHLHLLRRLGSGGTGHVFLCEIKQQHSTTSSSSSTKDQCCGGCYYALKVVDTECARVNKEKVKRAEMERRVLSVLDHPFLPTLYATFEAYHYSCFLIDYCHGGDLFTLQQQQPHLRFTVSTAKFYAAEVLVALEYLHMKGIIYRDLKPENVLIQEDGHLMLSDFDLSLYCKTHPKLLIHDITTRKKKTKKKKSPMFCCENDDVTERRSKRSGSAIADVDMEVSAEPTSARSTSFVGTHEYLAPEVILGEGHGGAVDWWAYGVFLYELLYGITPFKDKDNAGTMRNIVGMGKSKKVRFPRREVGDGKEEENENLMKAQDLIRKLLVRNPEKRTGYARGSCEIKKHQFFEGVNWALIRTVKPPIVPRDENYGISWLSSVKQKDTMDSPYQIIDFF